MSRFSGISRAIATLAAHGELDHWNEIDKVSATIIAGGGLLPMKGLEVDLRPLVGTITVRVENTVIARHIITEPPAHSQAAASVAPKLWNFMGSYSP